MIDVLCEMVSCCVLAAETVPVCGQHAHSTRLLAVTSMACKRTANHACNVNAVLSWFEHSDSSLSHDLTYEQLGSHLAHPLSRDRGKRRPLVRCHHCCNTKSGATCHPVGVSIVIPRHVGRLKLARASLFGVNIPSHVNVESSYYCNSLQYKGSVLSFFLTVVSLVQ